MILTEHLCGRWLTCSDFLVLSFTNVSHSLTLRHENPPLRANGVGRSRFIFDAISIQGFQTNYVLKAIRLFLGRVPPLGLRR